MFTDKTVEMEKKAVATEVFRSARTGNICRNPRTTLGVAVLALRELRRPAKRRGVGIREQRRRIYSTKPVKYRMLRFLGFRWNRVFAKELSLAPGTVSKRILYKSERIFSI